jgi:hypothetical protein
MDEESKQLLRQLVNDQKEQTELLRKHILPLWTRIRFSLLALFVLMTLVATGVGFTVVATRSKNSPNPATTATAVFAQPTATLRINVPPPFLDVGPPVTGELRPEASPTPMPDFSEN